MARKAHLQRQIFQPSCPSGGTWYACSTDSPSQFVGCCAGTGDPCKSSCSARNLRPASFDSTYYYYVPRLSCPSTSSFYKCISTQPDPFFGCCQTNPCSAGIVCSGSDLDAGSLPPAPSLAASFSPSSAASTSTSTSSSSSHSTSSRATASPSSSTTAVPVAASPSPKTTKIIAGSAGGGAALLAVVLGWFLYHCLYARRSRKIKQDELDRRLSTLPPIDKNMSEIASHGAAAPRYQPVPAPEPEPSSVYTPPRNVNNSGYAPISPISPSQAYAMPSPPSPPSSTSLVLPASYNSRKYSGPRNSQPYSHLSQISDDTLQEDLGSPRESGGNWTSYSQRGPEPWRRNSRDQISELPPIFGRRHSNEMNEDRYYIDEEGKERVRLSRSGSSIAVHGQNQGQVRH